MSIKGKKQPLKTVRKKRKTELSDLDSATKYEMIEDYQSGSFSPTELTDKYNLKSPGAVEKWLTRHINQLNVVKETSRLSTTAVSKYNYKPNNLINEPFLELLSDPEGELSEEEFSYVYLLTFVGENKLAIEESGLSAGLTAFGSKDSAAYKHAIRMRGLFLRQKRNVKEKYRELKLQKMKELTKEVDKDFVVNELVDLLDQLKENGDRSALVLSTIEKIGKAVGAFTERVEVTSITAASKLDQLIEMAKQEVVPTLPPDEVWEAEALEN